MFPAETPLMQPPNSEGLHSIPFEISESVLKAVACENSER